MEIISRINWVDVLAVIIVLRISYVAFQDGLSHEIFPLLGTIATIVLALHYSPHLSFFIANNMAQLPIEIANFITFTALIIIFGLIFKIARSFLDKIIKVTWHPVLDKFGGLAFGMIRAAIVVSVLLTIIMLAPIPYLQHSVRDRSLVGMRFLKIGPVIYSRVSRYLPVNTMGVKYKSSSTQDKV